MKQASEPDVSGLAETLPQIPDYRSWSSFRARINHDELANSLIPMSAAILNCVTGKVALTGGLDSLTESLVEVWRETSTRIEHLLSISDSVLRPSCMISRIDGIRPDPEVWDNLITHLDARWEHDYGLAGRARSIRGCLLKVSAVIDGTRTAGRFDAHLASELQQELRTLSQLLSRLESEL